MSTPCEQKDNIRHIQEELANHKEWRKQTSAQLSTIECAVATINERLKAKTDMMDDHVKAGNAFRVTLVFTVIGLAGSILTAAYLYGGLAKQVEINTARWNEYLEHKTVLK
jgi:hypothetical protein